MRTLGLSSYAAGALESLELAVRAVPAPGAEARAIGALRGESLDGVAVFGAFAGAVGAARLHLVVVDEGARRNGAGRALVDAAIAHARSEASRFVLAEVPDDARALPGAHAFLAAMGFREESRVEDFFRDGIALTFLRRDLESSEH